MGGKLEDNGFSLKDRPAVWVVMGKWFRGIERGAEEHIIGIFDDKDAAYDEVKAVLSGANPRAKAWVALHYLR